MKINSKSLYFVFVVFAEGSSKNVNPKVKNVSITSLQYLNIFC